MDYKRTPRWWDEHGHKSGEQLARENGGDSANWRRGKRTYGTNNEPKVTQIRKGVCVYDLHHPYHNKRLWTNILRFCEDFEPDAFVFGGDNLDLEVVSHWVGNRRRKVEGKRLKKDYLRFNNEVLSPLDDILSDDAERIFLLGNHEDWVEQYIDEHPEVEGFFEVRNNLDIGKWDVYEYGEVAKIGKLHFIHGTYITIHNAMKTAQVYGRNIVYGHGHCFDKDTELLTRRGWLSYDEITEDDYAMTMNRETEAFEWNRINQTFIFDADEDMYRFKSTVVDLLVDGEHGVVWKTDPKNNPTHYTTAAEVAERGKPFVFRVSGTNTNPEYNISDEMLRLTAWTLSDGSISRIGNTPYVDIAQSKPHNIETIRQLLDDLSFSYHLAERDGSAVSKLPPYRFRIHVEGSHHITALCPDKSVPEWFYHLSSRQFEIFLAEYIKGDGTEYPKRAGSAVFTNDPAWVDAFQHMLFLNGYRTNVYWKDVGTHFNRTSPCAQINITPQRTWAWLRDANVSRERYVGKKWCVSVDNQTLVVRRNGNVCVTQNTLQAHTITAPLDVESHTATQIPCACEMNPHYRRNQPNSWLNGFGVFYILPNGNFSLYPVVAVDGVFVAPNGQTYE